MLKYPSACLLAQLHPLGGPHTGHLRDQPLHRGHQALSWENPRQAERRSDLGRLCPGPHPAASRHARPPLPRASGLLGLWESRQIREIKFRKISVGESAQGGIRGVARKVARTYHGVPVRIDAGYDAVFGPAHGWQYGSVPVGGENVSVGASGA